mgnify:CR=1 FL=1
MIHRNSKLQEFSSFESLTANGSRLQFPVSGKLQFPGNSFPISGNCSGNSCFYTISTVHALGRLDCPMVRPMVSMGMREQSLCSLGDAWSSVLDLLAGFHTLYQGETRPSSHHLLEPRHHCRTRPLAWPDHASSSRLGWLHSLA